MFGERRRPSLRMKSGLVWWAGVLFLLSLAGGCSSPASEGKPHGESGGESPKVEETAKGEEVPNTSEAKPPKQSAEDERTAKAAHKLLNEPIAPKEVMKIAPPGSGGYKPSGEARLSSIGQKVDKALSQLPPALVDARITFSTAEGELFGKPSIKVQNPTTFRVEYNQPKSRADRTIIVGDGKKFAEQTPGGWKPRQKKGGTASAAEVEAWPMDFPSLMFEPLTDSRKVWEPVFASWAKKGAKVEERTQTVSGKKVTLYRVLVNDKSGQMEVVLDGKMMVPLTIRTDMPRKGGGRNQMMWTGRWSFGGTHKPGSFLIPVSKPKQS